MSVIQRDFREDGSCRLVQFSLIFNVIHTTDKLNGEKEKKIAFKKKDIMNKDFWFLVLNS